MLPWVAVFPLMLSAKTYYVSPSGKNTNPGTITAPWQTLAKVNQTTFKGDTILFLGGNTFLGGLTFTSSDVGTATKPIVISSYGTGRATIQPDSLNQALYVRNAAGFKITNINFRGPGIDKSGRGGILIYLDKDSTTLDYIDISYVEVSGFRDAGICIGSWIGISGFTNLSIKNCVAHDNGLAGISIYAKQPYIHKNVYVGYNLAYNNTGLSANPTGNTGSGIVVGDIDGGTIEFCVAYGNGAAHKNTSGGPVGIWAYSSKNTVIQFNESHHNLTGNTKDGGGFDLDGGCSNSILQYNYSHDNYGAGYLMAIYSGSPVAKNNVIRYNISENDGRKNDYGGIHLWSYYGTTPYIQGLEIYNNTIYISAISGASPKGFYVRSGALSGVNVRNNIFQIQGSVKLVNTPVTAGLTFQGNAYWPSGSAFTILWGTTSYSSLSAWQTATGQEKRSGTLTGIQADPLYSSTIKGTTYNDATQLSNLPGYRLSSTSTLVNKGLNLKSLFGVDPGARDFFGNPLAGKTTFHIGAYQGSPVTSTLKTSFDNVAVPGEIAPGESLSVFPNPVIDKTTIALAGFASGEVKIDLVDLQGRLVKSIFQGTVTNSQRRSLSLDLSSLNKGVYIVVLTDNTGKKWEKGILKL